MLTDDQIEEIKNDKRYIEPIFCERWHFESFSRVRCGSENHLAIHDIQEFPDKDINNFKFEDAYLINLPLDSYDNIKHKQDALLEQDEYGNTLFHIAVLMGYNTGNYYGMFIVIKHLFNIIREINCKIYDENNENCVIILSEYLKKNKYKYDFLDLISAIYRECTFYDSNPYGILKFHEHGSYSLHMNAFRTLEQILKLSNIEY